MFSASASRTLSSCIETIASIAKVESSPRSIAWLIIKLYYASYFAAHSHMQVCGESYVNLDAPDALRLLELARIQGTDDGVSKLSSGQYTISVTPGTDRLAYSYLPDKKIHEGLWFSYLECLKKQRVRTQRQLIIPQERDLVVDKLDDLIALLRTKGSNGGNWLSRIRNLVQYQHAYGVWYPYTTHRDLAATLLSKVPTTFREEPENLLLQEPTKTPDGELKAFFSGTMFLSCLARKTTLDLALRASSGNALARNGAASLLRIAGLN